MDDPQRKPGDRDRGPLVARIRRAADEGRIAPADRDIRVANVGSAQSMAELDLIARDLDQLEAALPAGSATAPAWTGPTPAPLADQVTDQAVGVARTTVRSIGVVTTLILVLLGVGGGALTFFRSSGSGEPRNVDLFTPVPVPTGDVTEEPADDPAVTPSPAGPAYALTGPGIRWLLAEYNARFGTTQVVDLTMYDTADDAYVVVQVPQAGTNRHAGFLYRQASGWQEFGSVTANFPGSEPVDLRQLDVPALVRNIARARRTLNVEDAATTYVIIDFRPQFDDVPNVDIHVANAFNESGYLATTLDGSVERAYPYAP